MDHADRPSAVLPSEVRIGGMSRSDLRRALRDRDVQLNSAAEALFEDRRFTTLARQHVIRVSALSVAALGFAEGATYGQLVAAALASGWTECPLELGPHLRLQFPDQADGTDGLPMTHGRAPPGSITVASPPLDDSDETPKGFYLRRVDGALWLRGYRSWSGHVWSPGDVLVFARCVAHPQGSTVESRQPPAGQ
jgi:hypothetical protein